MSEKSGNPQAPNRRCSTWAEVVEWLEEFPPDELAIGYEGEVTTTEWVFRGLKDSRYEHQPKIEREAQQKSMSWPALEVLISREFKTRAHMYLEPSSIPSDDLTWLARMQHYAIPTRLLDFTHSPFVALYFAIRKSEDDKDRDRTHVRLWAIDAGAVTSRFRSVASKAGRKKQKLDRTNSVEGVNIGDPEMYRGDRDFVIDELDWTLIDEALLATRQAYKRELNRQGCVCVASPRALNPRLASQQGMFLLNCAQGLSFSESLRKMMEPCNKWCKAPSSSSVIR
jgi:hypothetical protein